MAYFPNGTAGEMYQSKWCGRCANFRDKGDGRGPGCAIWDLHLLWNGESGDKREALDHFIPDSVTEFVECEMFLRIATPSRGEA